MRPHRWHYWITFLLTLVLVPALMHLRLPLQFDWIPIGIAYWVLLSAQAIFVAAWLALLGMPFHEVLWPLLDRYRKAPPRIAMLLVYFAILTYAFGWPKALVLTVDTAAMLELRERWQAQRWLQAGVAIFWPSLYLFGGFLLVLAYNTVIVSVRFNFAYDPAFNAMDRWVLLGHTVSGISHWAVRTFPVSFFHFLEFIYFGMFPQIGATIVLISLADGKKRGLQFVGTILLAYYVSLGLFYLWPSQGPSSLCVDHFATYPRSLQAYNIQKLIIAHGTALWNHVPIHRISTDYFIAFPCMHVTQPLIVMWFLRRWRRMVIALALYDVVLAASIILLEWHYAVDLIAGVLVAVVAIAVTDETAFSSFRRRGRNITEPASAVSPA